MFKVQAAYQGDPRGFVELVGMFSDLNQAKEAAQKFEDQEDAPNFMSCDVQEVAVPTYYVEGSVVSRNDCIEYFCTYSGFNRDDAINVFCDNDHPENCDYLNQECSDIEVTYA